jgi:colanic acid biosynthesis glycosyl transferase WcaI
MEANSPVTGLRQDGTSTRTDRGLLFVSPFYAPEPISTGKYNARLVAALGKSADITVITSYPIYPQWRPRKVEDAGHDPRVVRGGLRIRYPANPLARRAILELWFAIFAMLASCRAREYRAIVAVCPPTLFLLLMHGVIGKSRKRICIVHDLQGVYANARKSALGVVLTALIRAVEGRAFKSCDAVIFLSETMRDLCVEQYGLDRNRTYVCYPFSTLDFSARSAHNNRLVNLFATEYRHIVYSGALGEKQNPEALINAFLALVNLRRDVYCHVFSAGPVFDQISVRVGHVDRMLFHGLVDERDLGELYARSDVQVIPQAPGTEDGSLPSKFPNLLEAGVRVFAICRSTSELARLVETSGAGQVHSDWNPKSIALALSEHLDRHSQDCKFLHEARRSASVRSRFSIDATVRTIEAVAFER